jgi:hypothetical protein
MVVSAGIALTLIAVAVTATRWHRSGRLSQRSYLVAFALSAALVLLAQLLPRIEERWHCVQYGILGGLCWGAVRGRLRPWLTATMIVATAGWLDEGVQWFLPERVYDLWDVALNAASGAAGAGVAEVSRRASRKSELLEVAQ